MTETIVTRIVTDDFLDFISFFVCKKSENN